MINPQYLTIFFVTVVALKLGLESWLSWRNKQHIQNARGQVPPKFAATVSLAEHQKAADYSATKINYGFLFNVINTLLLLLWTVGGGLNYINEIAITCTQHLLGRGLVYFALFAGLSTLLSLPESLISTFIIEEKFGFNRTTLKTFCLDLLKGTILSVLIAGPLLAGILAMMEYLGSHWWWPAWCFLTLMQLLILFIYPILIAPLFNKFSPLPEGEVKSQLVQMLTTVQFPYQDLFVMDASKRSQHGNAYFTGIGKKRRIVFYDTLLQSLNAHEIVAVLAHEVGHFKHRHVLKMLVKNSIVSFLAFALLGKLFNWIPFYQGHGVEIPSSFQALLLFTLVGPVYSFFLTPLFSYFSRRHEFEADAFAATFADPHQLISALTKLYKENASSLTPDPLFSAVYHSHPPALIRVQNLERLALLKVQNFR